MYDTIFELLQEGTLIKYQSNKNTHKKIVCNNILLRTKIVLEYSKVNQLLKSVKQSKQFENEAFWVVLHIEQRKRVGTTQTYAIQFLLLKMSFVDIERKQIPKKI